MRIAKFDSFLSFDQIRQTLFFSNLQFPSGVGNVHHISETGNMKHLVDLCGNIRYDKTVFTKYSKTDKAKSQKWRGNKNDFGKIEIQLNIFTIFLEVRHSLYQVVLNFRTYLLIEPT